MNLENLGVQEMNSQEIKNVDGGIFATVWACCWLANLAVESCAGMYQMGYDSATR